MFNQSLGYKPGQFYKRSSLSLSVDNTGASDVAAVGLFDPCHGRYIVCIDYASVGPRGPLDYI